MTLSKLIKELQFAADVHGFRTSFRMWTQKRPAVHARSPSSALAHVTRDKAEAAYARSDLSERRRTLMEEWADFLWSAIRLHSMSGFIDYAQVRSGAAIGDS